MPLPHVAFEGGLGVELELMNVDILAEQLPQRLNEARMPREQAEHLAEGVRGKRGPRCPGLLAPDFLAVLRENTRGFRAKQRDLLLGEAIGEEHVTLLIEGLQLVGRQSHGAHSRKSWGLCASLPADRPAA